MLSTAYTQLVIYSLIAWAGLVTAGLIALAYTTSKKFRLEIASKTAINRFNGSVSTLSGDLADLSDRFSRFQKREGMRVARDTKSSAVDLKAEAAALMANKEQEAMPGESPKAALYRRMRGQH